MIYLSSSKLLHITIFIIKKTKIAKDVLDKKAPAIGTSTVITSAISGSAATIHVAGISTVGL